MQKQTKRIYQAIKENLSQLYMFAVSMTSSQKEAERLIQTLFAELDNQHEYLVEYTD